MSQPEASSRITDVHQLRRRRRQLTLEDGRVFVFGDEACERLHVRGGMAAPAELLEALDAEDRKAGLHDAALTLLSYRPRSEAELRQRLRRRGADDEAIDVELTRLRNAGLVDDARFAQSWVESRQLSSPRSARLLRQELRAKGVIGESVEQAIDVTDDARAALQLARSRGTKLRSLDFAEFANKVGGALQRRGFSYGVSAAAVRAAWTDLQGDASETDGAAELL